MKNIAIITFILFLSHCGYSSIYKNQQSLDFQFNIIKTEGDNEMNNLIKNEIKLYTNADSKKIYNIKINTDYKKKVLTKNSSGVITDYNLTTTSEVTINLKDQIKIFEFEESINIKKGSEVILKSILDLKDNYNKII